MITVVQASSTAQLQDAKTLFTEYFAFLQREVDTEVDDLDDVPPIAGYREELATLPGRYAPPDGRLLVAYDGIDSAGCVALYQFDTGICEVKRLWVRPAFRSKQVGRRLMETLITEARTAGYHTVLLGTVDKLKSATALYTSLGFQPTAPYFDLPPTMIAHEVFLRLDLAHQASE